MQMHSHPLQASLFLLVWTVTPCINVCTVVMFIIFFGHCIEIVCTHHHAVLHFVCTLNLCTVKQYIDFKNELCLPAIYRAYLDLLNIFLNFYSVIFFMRAQSNHVFCGGQHFCFCNSRAKHENPRCLCDTIPLSLQYDILLWLDELAAWLGQWWQHMWARYFSRSTKRKFKTSFVMLRVQIQSPNFVLINNDNTRIYGHRREPLVLFPLFTTSRWSPIRWPLGDESSKADNIPPIGRLYHWYTILRPLIGF